MKSSFPPIVNNQSKVLILGSMPGEKSLALQQYYGNHQNQFWKLLFSVFDEPFIEDYQLRIEFLHRKHIALWDVLAECTREGSLDSKIRNAAANDFNDFHSQYPQIKTIFFSSKAAAQFYDKLVGKMSDLNYYILPSPSGANATKTFSQKLEEWKAISSLL